MKYKHPLKRILRDNPADKARKQRFADVGRTVILFIRSIAQLVIDRSGFPTALRSVVHEAPFR
jgi:hypothetical protein